MNAGYMECNNYITISQERASHREIDGDDGSHTCYCNRRNVKPPQVESELPQFNNGTAELGI